MKILLPFIILLPFCLNAQETKDDIVLPENLFTVANEQFQPKDTFDLGERSIFDTEVVNDTLFAQLDAGFFRSLNVTVSIDQMVARRCLLQTQQGNFFFGDYEFSRNLFETTFGANGLPTQIAPGQVFVLPFAFTPSGFREFDYFGTTTDGVSVVYENCTDISNPSRGLGNQVVRVRLIGTYSDQGNTYTSTKTFYLKGNGTNTITSTFEEVGTQDSWLSVSGNEVIFDENTFYELFDVGGKLLRAGQSNTLSLEDGLYLLSTESHEPVKILVHEGMIGTSK